MPQELYVCPCKVGTLAKDGYMHVRMPKENLQSSEWVKVLETVRANEEVSL